MEKQKVEFAVLQKDGVIQRVGVAHVLVPMIEFKGGTVPWFDDNKLLKTNRAGKSTRGYEVVSK